MQMLHIEDQVCPPHLYELRVEDRHQVSHMLVITKRGTGQILDLSKDGLSFGCLYPHDFPNEWEIDIIDASGHHLKSIAVRKVWLLNENLPETLSKFEVLIGVEFINLSRYQKQQLEDLLEQLELVQSKYLSLL